MFVALFYIHKGKKCNRFVKLFDFRYLIDLLILGCFEFDLTISGKIDLEAQFILFISMYEVYVKISSFLSKK